MRSSKPCAAALAALLATAAAAAGVEDTSHTAADGTRTLQQSVVVPAPAVDVWAALTTSEGWRSWAAPVAEVDFRLDGVIETSYDPNAVAGAPGSIRNRIVAYAPPRMFAIRNVQAPPRTAFDVPTFQSLHTVVFVEAVSERSTRVSFTQPGYRAGEPYDTVYRHFAWGNGWTLEQLKRRFEDGPVDWKKRLEAAAKK